MGKAKILLIDDEADVLNILSKLLSTAGYDSESVMSGPDAIARIEQEQFDLVISDIRMGPVSGIDVLQASRRLRPSLPFVLLTAYASENTRREARNLGAYAYLTKPFRMSALLSTVDRALAETGVIDENEVR